MIDPIVYHPDLHRKQQRSARWPWRRGRWKRPVFTMREALKNENGGR